MWRRSVLRAALAAPIALVGCAQAPLAPPTSTEEGTPRTFWSGRLALQVQDQPSRSFMAAFELQGQASTGSLHLSTPLGSTLAQLHWSPQGARLTTNNTTEEAASVDALLERSTGAPIPVVALFDWLSGQSTPLDGWSTDLSAIAQGRLRATRFHPEPQTTLRITFEP